MENKGIESAINFESLLKLGFAVIDARYFDYDITNEPYKLVITRVTTDRDDFYRDMLKSYFPKFEVEKNIYEVWTAILEHKISMSKVLNRDVSIKVAVYDYLETSK